MNKTKSKPYNLLHITSNINAKLILKSGFKLSEHKPKLNQNQWLGDGVYFWDGNDDGIEEFGKEVLKNKFSKKDMVSIYGSISIEKEKHINLEKDSDREDFCNFIKHNFKKGEEILNLISILRKKPNVKKTEMAKIGKFLGVCINMYMIFLKEKNCNIDMVSCYFYHGTGLLNFFGRSEKARRQFCIKNIEFLNNNINDFKIY